MKMLRNCEEKKKKMDKLIKKAEACIDKELEENVFIEDSDIIGSECRYLDNLAEKLAIREILGDDIYEKDGEEKYDAYSNNEQEILGLADELLEAIHESIMPKYNCFQDSINWKFFYKIDKKFDTREECLNFFDMNF